jgi:hypothetical protein
MVMRTTRTTRQELVVAAACAATAAFFAGCASQAVRGSIGSNGGVRSLIAAERAFARHSERAGIKESFIANMAPDGLLFRPGPVNGLNWLNTHPPARGYLSWDPEIAAISSSGELGYTTGPWEFRAAGPKDSVSGSGHYVTVWKRDSTRAWKMAVDIGTGHRWMAKPEDAVGSVISRASTLGADAQEQLFARDSAVGRGAPQSASLLGAMAEDARAHREGEVPALGIENVRRAFAGDDRPYHSKRLGGGIARAGDFGYTYGEYELVASFTHPAQRGYYLRLWRVDDNAWRVILDLAQPARAP